MCSGAAVAHLPWPRPLRALTRLRCSGQQTGRGLHSPPSLLCGLHLSQFPSEARCRRGPGGQVAQGENRRVGEIALLPAAEKG